MRSSSRHGKRLEVFDWKEEEEAIESSTVGRIMGKFGKAKKPSSSEGDAPLTKYTFLQSFAKEMSPQKIGEIRDIPCVDVDDANSDHEYKNFGSDDLGKSDGGCAIDHAVCLPEENPVTNSNSKEEHAITYQHTSDCKLILPGCSSFSTHTTESSKTLAAEALFPGMSSSGKEEVNYSIMDLPSINDPVDVISDDDASVVHTSEIGEGRGSFEGLASDDSSSSWLMEKSPAGIAVTPDYLLYGDKYSTESSLTFCSSGIKLYGINANGSKEPFSKEWVVDEVNGIVSQWYERVETALVKLSILPSVDEAAESSDGHSEVMELKFSVCDPSWFETQERIMLIDARYRAVWRELLNTDGWEMNVIGKNGTSNCYYPNFSEPFEDVVYPKGDPDAVSISKRDVELLQPETFINDTIIDFYIKYLKNKIEPQNRLRYHFFNSFFFRKLADLDKNPASASEGRAAFLRVRKWTRKFNLFEKDFVFIPVNFNLHWSLLVICHPGEVVGFRDEEIDKSLRVPCILHLDSIKGSHKGLKNLIQSYLWEEWKERHEVSSEDVSSNFLNMRFVPLEVPQQENSFDCGLFLLHFVELFLEEAPIDFSPFTITNFSNFLTMDWFPPAEASLKRSFIQKLIYELVERDSQKTGPDDCSDECYPSCSMEKDNENGSEFHLDRQSPAKGSHGYSCSAADQGIEIKLLTESSSRSQFASESSLILRELLEPGPTAGSFPNEQVQTQDQISSFHSLKNVTLPVKEEESDEHFAFTPSGGVVSPSPIGISSSACRTSYASKSFTIVDRINLDTMREDKHYGNFLSPEASFGSQNSSEARVDEHLSLGGFGCPDVQEKKEEPRSASQENIGCVTGSPASVSSDRLENSIVEDSQVVAGLTENEGKKDHYIVEDSQEVAGLTENEDKKDHFIVEDSQEMVGLTENEDKKGHCIVQDSQEVGGLTEDGDKKRKDCHEDFLASFDNPTDSRENKNHMDGHVQLGSEGLLSGPEQQSSKRQRLAPEGERQYRRSVSKDCHS